jgi:hypothetical protein
VENVFIPIPNENHSFVGASLATPGLITVLQQRASQAKPLHGSASKVYFSLGKGIMRLKGWRAIATRYAKNAQSVLAAVQIRRLFLGFKIL